MENAYVLGKRIQLLRRHIQLAPKLFSTRPFETTIQTQVRLVACRLRHRNAGDTSQTSALLVRYYLPLCNRRTRARREGFLEETVVVFAHPTDRGE